MRLPSLFFRYLLVAASAVLFFSVQQYAVPASHRTDGTQTSRQYSQEAAPFVRISGKAHAIADFDGDLRRDYVAIHRGENRYQIVVWLSTRPGATTWDFSASAAGLSIHACDINHDSYQDIVIAGPASLHPLRVWLGNGKGQFETADRNRFWSNLELSGSSKIQTIPVQPDLDLIAESSYPVFDCILPAAINTILVPKAFVDRSNSVHTLQPAFFSAAPRSPPGYSNS